MMIFSISKKGFYLEYSPKPKGDANSENSQFCGENYTKGPECINCKKPFLKIFDLDTNCFIGNIEFGELERIILIFCWTCTFSQKTFFYDISDHNDLKLISLRRGEKIRGFPYDRYPTFFPEGRVKPVEISEEIQQMVTNVNSGKTDEFDVNKKYEKYLKPSHQIGGEPYLVQKNFIVSPCPNCEKEMPFLASVADQCLDPRGFTGNNFVQIIYSICIFCKVIGAYQCCD